MNSTGSTDLLKIALTLPGSYEISESDLSKTYYKKIEKEVFALIENVIKDFDKIDGITHYYRVDISKAPKAKKDYRVRMAPTIFIFKDGIKEESFKAGLDLECPVDLTELQETIDELKKSSQF